MLAGGNDYQLVDKALGGSERAWLTLIRRYEKRIYNHALRMTGNPDDAMDILQDVMMSAYRNLKSYRQEGSFAAWLFRIASFRSMDYLRRRRHTFEDSVDELPDHQAGA
ncbi:MAG: sigma-70 family RNA polymerase sigma factor, partial [Pseudomonadales bacterium]|nr:sigma-70 family RNA polymerase sigma factor [Pseudomonadales bacterium]